MYTHITARPARTGPTGCIARQYRITQIWVFPSFCLFYSDFCNGTLPAPPPSSEVVSSAAPPPLCTSPQVTVVQKKQNPDIQGGVLQNDLNINARHSDMLATPTSGFVLALCVSLFALRVAPSASCRSRPCVWSVRVVVRYRHSSCCECL
jgi:hypothetical protein